MTRKPDKKPDNDLKKLEKDTSQRLPDSVNEHIKSAVETATLQEFRKFSESIDKRIGERFRTATILAVVIIAFFSAFGFFGIQYFVNSVFKEHISEAVVVQLAKIRAEAEGELGKIKAARRACEAPLIVIQTDYGAQSYYMGRLKGIIYNINPNARIDLITCEVAEFDVINAAFTLWRASGFYPSGTIFVVVTNPGGITTEMIIVETMNGHIYIGHDNGCFDLVVQNYGYKSSYRIASPELTPPRFQDLFGGVDTFGPAAAKISLGFDFSKAGPRLDHYNPKLPNVQHRVNANYISGTVMDIDKYGNATTNIKEHDLEKAEIRVNSICKLELDNGKFNLQVPFKRTYGNVSKGEPLILLYEGMLQLAVNEGSFAEKFCVTRGTLVKVIK